METEAGPRRPRGVAMETSPELGLGCRGARRAQNPAEPLGEAEAAVRAARWDLRKHSLLIVIGDIGTESQLRAVRAHLEQGEPLSLLCPRASFTPSFSAIRIHLLHHLVCVARGLRAPITGLGHQHLLGHAS